MMFEHMTPEEWAAAMDAERERQIEHGYDDAHDAEHGIEHILNWAIDYARRGRSLAASTMTRSALRLLAARDSQVLRDAAYSGAFGTNAQSALLARADRIAGSKP